MDFDVMICIIFVLKFDFDVMICIIFVLKFETSPVLTKAFEKITRTSRLFSSVLLDIC